MSDLINLENTLDIVHQTVKYLNDTLEHSENSRTDPDDFRDEFATEIIIQLRSLGRETNLISRILKNNTINIDHLGNIISEIHSIAKSIHDSSINYIKKSTRDVHPVDFNIRNISLRLLESADLLVGQFEEFYNSDESIEITGRVEFLSGPVTDQQSAPFKFELVHNRLRVARENENAGDHGQTAETVRQITLDNGEKLVEQLLRSQIDRRFLEVIQDLHALFKTNADIIRLGLQASQCKLYHFHYAEEHEGELSPMITAGIENYLNLVENYVAQFPAWHDFQEKVSAANAMDRDAIDAMRDLSSQLHARLSNTTVADPDVMGAMEWVHGLLSNASDITQKKAISAARTLSNLYAAITKGIAKLTLKEGAAIAEELKKEIAKIFVNNLLKQLRSLETVLGDDWFGSAIKLLIKSIDTDAHP